MIRRIVKKVLAIPTKLVRRTNWWNNRYVLTGQFMPQPLFRAFYKRNYNFVCLGGESAGFTVEVDNCMNLASGKTTIQLVFEIFKFYHSYLRKHGTVLLSFSPFEILNQPQLSFIDYARFIKPLPVEEKHKVGDYYSPEIYLLDLSQVPAKTRLYFQRPFLYEPWKCMKSVVWDEAKDNRKTIEEQTVNSLQLEKMAECLAKTNLKEIDYDEIEKEIKCIVAFCRERDYQPVLLINPINGHLAKYIPEDFYAFINQLSQYVEVWDYSQNTELMFDTLYQGLEVMNKKGRDLYSNLLNKRLTLR